MTKNQRGNKPMSRTFIFETDAFDAGMDSVLKNVPELNVYFEDKEIICMPSGVVSNLLDTVNTDPPCVDSDNFPNTLSIYVSAKELAFLGDNGIAFGWRLFNNVKKGAKFIYQFRITFITNSMVNKKYMTSLLNNGWKERDLSEKQSRFWNEASHTNRIPNLSEQRNGRGEPTATNSTRSDELQKDLNEKPVPNQVSQSKHEKSENAKMANREIVQNRRSKAREWNPQPLSENKGSTYNDANGNDEQLGSPIENSERDSGRVQSVNESATVTSTTQPQQRPYIMDTPVQAVQQDNTQVRFEQTDEDITYQQHEQNRQMCAIFRGPKEFIFLINHYGQMVEVNLNEKAPGVMVDRGSGNIVIGDMSYNYLNFQVNYLGGPPMVEQAQKMSPISGKMLKHRVPDDSVFVPQSTIDKMHENYEASPNVISNGPLNNNIARRPQATSLIIPKPQNRVNNMAPGSVLRAGRNLIIDKRTPIQPDHPGVGANGVAIQSVRMTNDGPGMM